MIFEPHPSGLVAMWDHWADLEAEEMAREEREAETEAAEFRDAAHYWIWRNHER